MLESKKVVFTKAFTVELQSELLDDVHIPEGHVLLKKHYSLISAGTELACLSGKESWFPFPGVPGYTCAGEIVKTGADVSEFRPGDMVFCYGNHSQYQILPVSSPWNITIHIPAGLDLKYAPFARMASIAATAIRVSDIEWGDVVAVTGQGLVGNMAMQLARIQGAIVVAIDIVDSRLEIAKKCGSDYILNSTKQNIPEEILRLTGESAATLIEATGVPAVIIQAIHWVKKNGEMIMLGTPRGEYKTDVTHFLNITQQSDTNVALKGAHEWRYPVMQTPFCKHSLERNTKLIFNMILKGKLVINELLTCINSPVDCQQVYDNLKNDKNRYMAMLFDWC